MHKVRLNHTAQIIIVLLLTVFVWGCKSKESNKEKALVVPPLTPEVVEYNPATIDDNYVFAVEGGGQAAYLLDKSGKKIHEWKFDLKLGNDAQLLPTGQVLGIFKSETATIKFGGGYAGVIRLINPDSSIEWEYVYESPEYLSHHDAELLPNGNLIFLAWEKISVEKGQAVGVNADYDIYPEKILEVNLETKEVVWEWHSWDHIVQDVKEGVSTYGNVNENPNKININYNLRKDGDIMHANGLTYDPDNDLLYVSVNFYSEVWVIDHSTTTAEAATNQGGNYNKGGELIYRFGNPETYNNTSGKKIFDHVHFPNLLGEGVPGTGNILVYNNGLKAKQSEVFELKMPTEFMLIPDEDNEPEIIWSYTNSELSYGRISGADRLSNGNTLICEGDYGFWEVTPLGEIAWKYKNQTTTYWRGYGFNREADAVKSLKLKN
ncbi:aryl-sulfate sulfotransferase [Fulvivirga lutimaris]|uniref:aryl-sulfate sulfotransferase n=1 Tax=Fulvivirga lutimaris TaxID=1819566 RepID=UPI0012BBB7B4|nr:aryl-sulfate sulfotransferase [Fulvivirga lutimaris]MTI39927.1 hypothetical protein [Fulvivirga lutimaris]